MVMRACVWSRFSQSIGFAAAHCTLALDQSYETMPNCAPRSGEDQPEPLHVMVMVLIERLSAQTGAGG